MRNSVGPAVVLFHKPSPGLMRLAFSTVFTSEADREKAKVIALTYGKKIAKSVPLGYKDGQLLIVFHDNCPNNSIPILWATGTSSSPWTPLFGRSY